MARPRKEHTHLPDRASFHHGAYWWRPTINGKQRRIPLGRNYRKAMRRYKTLERDRA